MLGLAFGRDRGGGVDFFDEFFNGGLAGAEAEVVVRMPVCGMFASMGSLCGHATRKGCRGGRGRRRGEQNFWRGRATGDGGSARAGGGATWLVVSEAERKSVVGGEGHDHTSTTPKSALSGLQGVAVPR